MKKGNHVIGNPQYEGDVWLAREQRNIAEVYNPALRGQRGCHHGFYPPRKIWTSRLQQAMDEYDAASQKGGTSL